MLTAQTFYASSPADRKPADHSKPIWLLYVTLAPPTYEHLHTHTMNLT